MKAYSLAKDLDLWAVDYIPIYFDIFLEVHPSTTHRSYNNTKLCTMVVVLSECILLWGVSLCRHH